MKKIKYIIILIILLILVFASVFVFSNLAEKKRINDKFVYNSWNRVRDEYMNTGNATFPGEPVEHTLLYFSDGKIRYCIKEEVDVPTSSGEIETNSEYSCKDYNYVIDDGKLIVNINGKEITYIYEFLDNNQLLLNYVGEGFEFKFYYSASAG